MAPYVAREASKVRLFCLFLEILNVCFGFFFFWFDVLEWMQLWRRFLGELSVEVKLLIEKWKLLLAGLVFQV